MDQRTRVPAAAATLVGGLAETGLSRTRRGHGHEAVAVTQHGRRVRQRQCLLGADALLREQLVGSPAASVVMSDRSCSWRSSARRPKSEVRLVALAAGAVTRSTGNRSTSTTARTLPDLIGRMAGTITPPVAGPLAALNCDATGAR